MNGPSHLVWIPAGAAVGFLAALIFGDLLPVPTDLYYLIYFLIGLGFLVFYVRSTGLDLRVWITRRWGWALLAGVVGGLVLIQGVLRQPATPPLRGGLLGWALLWRGLVYGAVDGFLLLGFPWVVTWRALNPEGRGVARKAAAGLVAWTAILLVTTVYHFGYRDFRSPRIVQPNIGSAIGSLPTLVTANPLASPISHIFLHVAAVLHAPDTDLFLPPHRR